MNNGLRRLGRVGLVLGVLVAATAAAPGAAPVVVSAAPATVAIYNVNSPNDVVANFSSDPGFTVCHTINPGICTLRAAVMNANRHLGGAIINLPANTYVLQLAPVGLNDDASGDLDLTQSVTILGAGAASTVIDGSGVSNLFMVYSGTVAALSGLTLQHGNNTKSLTGGAIDDRGQLTLTDSVVRDNYAGGGGGLFLYDGASATLDRVTVADNSIGGIQNEGSLTITNSSLTGNFTTFGDGGAIQNLANLTIFNSTLSNNSSAERGGAIANSGAATLLATTIAGNLAANAGSATATGGGIFNAPGNHPLHLYNTLLADNYVSHTVNEASGLLDSQDYNLIQSTSGLTLSGVTTHNVVNIPFPFIGELADNGGSTQTRALLAGSPALDQIPATLNGPCRDPGGAAPVPDQRGAVRPVNGLCDIGSYEGQQPLSYFGRNLLFNPDAEASAGSPAGVWVGVPGWNTSGQFTAVPYNAPGGFPSVPTDTVPANRGANFFAGGHTITATAQQTFFMQSVGGLIDTGRVTFVLSADLGGYRTQADNAQVEVKFLDQGFLPAGAGRILGPVTAADRSNQTGFRHRFVFDNVPATTRFIAVKVTLTRVSSDGDYNDGYADNIALALTPPPLFLPLLWR